MNGYSLCGEIASSILNIGSSGIDTKQVPGYMHGSLGLQGLHNVEKYNFNP